MVASVWLRTRLCTRLRVRTRARVKYRSEYNMSCTAACRSRIKLAICLFSLFFAKPPNGRFILRDLGGYHSKADGAFGGVDAVLLSCWDPLPRVLWCFGAIFLLFASLFAHFLTSSRCGPTASTCHSSIDNVTSQSLSSTTGLGERSAKPPFSPSPVKISPFQDHHCARRKILHETVFSETLFVH